MNEITLSDNLQQIELEISHHKQIAGQSIWEIGRRLKHVKEQNLTHGQFGNWVESIGIAKTEASRFIKIAEEIPNLGTYTNLGTKALYLIATLPDDQKQEQLERIENGDNPTVRELQEIKRENNHIKHTEAEKATSYLKSLSYGLFTPFETRETPKQKEIIELENKNNGDDAA
ncbi:TPA: DUF3102 domain-containing protein [Streptococcus pyogenes]|uniref:DUF3102 domain-containing protein n=1 Tax=Streptococcus TaxID=1301 RepID=UPI0009B50AFD|nr:MULTISPECIES: DUF3102 domain-containing protein [Streptococcus]HER4795312.1 DUF3102 domain-containing protein [Streptococcus pyogenes NGAS104]HER5198972.1 DUF3102 domain-containing protein [Streptococcus pyogenes MGAS15009]HER5280605.1 DUF3102 domain-containing protein [Streptococcus pyogenes MGAS15061]SQH47691.1 Protein of uncharacterised function (DUF3102) [Streptococcus pyogenes]VGT55794.1 Protein of uncharacterised function (DUF3102) [Streptococcus pyogenes]